MRSRSFVMLELILKQNMSTTGNLFIFYQQTIFFRCFTFPKTFCQTSTSQCVFSQMSTFQIGYFPSGNFPILYQPQSSAPYTVIAVALGLLNPFQKQRSAPWQLGCLRRPNLNFWICHSGNLLFGMLPHKKFSLGKSPLVKSHLENT